MVQILYINRVFCLKCYFFPDQIEKNDSKFHKSQPPPPLLSIEYCGTHKKTVKLEEDIEAILCAFDVVVKKIYNV